MSTDSFLYPSLGDFADTFLGFLVVRTAKQVEGGLPFNILLTMYFWLVVDLIIGLVPFVGDVADALVLANTRNAATLEDYLRKKGQKNLRSSGLPVPATDPSDPAEFDRLHTGSPNTSQPSRGNEGPANKQPSQHAPQTSGVTSVQSPLPPPAPARVHDNQQGRSSGGFFGFGRKKSRPTDVETGTASAEPGRRG